MDLLFSDVKSVVCSWAYSLKSIGMMNADSYIKSASDILTQKYSKYGFAKKDCLFFLSGRQVFIHTKHLNNREINFVFDMRVLEKIPSSSGQTIPLALFKSAYSKEPGKIIFSPVPNISVQNKMNPSPITIVPFYLEENRSFLVIDGNHRVTQAIQMGKSDIRANILSSHFIYPYIHGPLEQALYLLSDEINMIANDAQRRPFRIEPSQSFFLSNMKEA